MLEKICTSARKGKPKEIHRERDASIPENVNELLDEYQTAKLVHSSVSKLRRDRWAGGGIPFVKLSDKGAVRYRRKDIDEFIESRVRKSTSDKGNGTN